MGRYFDFNPGAKVTAAAATTVFSATDVPANGVVAYTFAFTGAGMTAGDCTYRVKAGGSSIIDVPFLHLAALFERYAFSNRVPLAADTSITIPLWLPGLRNQGDSDICQMPRGAQPTLEVVVGAGGAAGTVTAGWWITDVEAKLYPVMLNNALNFPVGPVNNQRYPIFEPGTVKGFTINTLGLARIKATLSGVQKYQADAPHAIESERYDSPVVQVDPIAIDLAGPDLMGGLMGTAGNSFLEADVTGAWVGVANSSVLYALRAQK